MLPKNMKKPSAPRVITDVELDLEFGDNCLKTSRERNFALLPSTSLCRLRRSHGIEYLERRLAAESIKFTLVL